MKLKERYGSVALVAGASEGLGAAYAHALAKEGFELILVARREEQLQKFSSALKGMYGINVRYIVCDLGESTAMEKILHAIGPVEIDFMVYNAAALHIGPFLNFSGDDQVKIAATNMITPLKMVHYFGNRMVIKGKGGIVLMTSLAAFQGSPFIATYAATKAFLLTLAESLWFEWKNKGVDIIACCAGVTATPNFKKSNPVHVGWFRPQVQTPEAVVEECYRKIGHAPSLISGMSNRIASFFMRKILSRRMAVKIMGTTTKKMYRVNY